MTPSKYSVQMMHAQMLSSLRYPTAWCYFERPFLGNITKKCDRVKYCLLLKRSSFLEELMYKIIGQNSTQIGSISAFSNGLAFICGGARTVYSGCTARS